VVHFSTHFSSERNERSPKTGNWDLLSEKWGFSDIWGLILRIWSFSDK
jgi:hypothetical protein